MGRLSQGNLLDVKGTDAIEFINQHQVPEDSSATCAAHFCDYRTLIQESHRVRITVGGDRLPHDQDTGSPATNMLKIRLF